MCTYVPISCSSVYHQNSRATKDVCSLIPGVSLSPVQEEASGVKCMVKHKDNMVEVWGHDVYSSLGTQNYWFLQSVATKVR